MSKTIRPLKGRLLLTGEVQLLSPAIIGCGENERADIDLLLDNEGKPFIPATSFVGVLRSYLTAQVLDREGVSKKDTADDLKRFWGFPPKEQISESEPERQSNLRCANLHMKAAEQPVTAVRDGIAIENKTGIVKTGAKYEYEIVERDTVFQLTMEAEYEDDNEKFVKQMMKTIRDELEKGNVQVGAKTNNGMGQLKLTAAKIYDYDFSAKDSVVAWLSNEKNVPELADNIKAFPLTTQDAVLEADFDLANALIIRAYEGEHSDATHIESNGKKIIPGSSLKGALRSRAERILNTISGGEEKYTSAILNNLFGFVSEESKEARKGRLKVAEKKLPAFVAQVQRRIKIDRFTGGTIEGGLFDSMPLFNHFKNEETIDLNKKVVQLKVTVKNCREHEGGLLVLLLKDLWTGDLAIGGEKNIGRGVFRGLAAKLTIGPEVINLTQSLEISDADQEKLQGYVDALNNYTPGGKKDE